MADIEMEKSRPYTDGSGDIGRQMDETRKALPKSGALIRSCAVEYVGNLIFIFTIVLAVHNAGPSAPLAIGSVLMVLVYGGGHVSGGHYNPAVSLGIYLRTPKGGFDAISLCCYIVAQVLGAVSGGALGYAMSSEGVRKTSNHAINHVAWPGPRIAPGPGFNEGQMFTVELIYTFLLVSTVLNTATSDFKSYDRNSFFGLAIGFSVVVGAFSAGGISGGAFNPAVAIGVQVAAGMAGETAKYLWVPLVADFLGGLLAAIFYLLFVNPHHNAEKNL